MSQQDALSLPFFNAPAAMTSTIELNHQPSRRAAPSCIFVSFLAAWLALFIAAPGFARESNAAGSMRVADLPPQGREILLLIRKGGPFKHAAKDGSVFGNFERILPKQPRGYYKEYTVPTPGAKNRGARRIVCGGEVREAARSVCYYTHDHYASFKRIQE